MKAMTPGEIAAGLLTITVAEAVIFGLVILMLVAIARDVVAEERRKARLKAQLHAERMAQRRVKEILRTTKFVMPIALINESDIDWGEGRSREE